MVVDFHGFGVVRFSGRVGILPAGAGIVPGPLVQKRFRAKGAEDAKGKKKAEDILPRITRIPTDGMRAKSGRLVWTGFPQQSWFLSVSIRGSKVFIRFLSFGSALCGLCALCARFFCLKSHRLEACATVGFWQRGFITFVLPSSFAFFERDSFLIVSETC